MSQPPARRRPPVLTFVLLAAGTLLLIAGSVAAVLTWGSYTIPSAAMERTLKPGDTLAADRTSDVRRGDVVVLEILEWNMAGKPQVKRVIGIGGDRVVCCDAQKRLTVNGTPLTEDYVDEPNTRPFSAQVPPGRLWIMGDNRLASYDSPHHTADPGGGTVAETDVKARVIAVGTQSLGTPSTYTDNGLADSRTLPPAPVLGFLAAALGLLTLLAAAATGLLHLRRRRLTPSQPRSPRTAPPRSRA